MPDFPSVLFYFYLEGGGGKFEDAGHEGQGDQKVAY